MGAREGEVEVGRMRKKKEEKRRKYLHGWHETEFLTNFCMFDCE